MPNIGAFIAWGIITALFIPTGWLPNENMSALVGPMITYLLPLLIGFTGGKIVYGVRGGVIGAIATMGVIVGADIPMFLGAMMVGPLGGFVIKQVDKLFEGKVRSGFEMLVNNFAAGIVGAILAIIALLGVGPVVEVLMTLLAAAVDGMVNAGLIPLANLFIEPAKILFLNNAINHGVLAPIGVSQVIEQGRSMMFLLESNPGPGLGVLLAFMLAGKGAAKSSSFGAVIIHFFGGIHEIYFPYVLMKPALLLSVIAGGVAGTFTFNLFDAGLVATPSPGSIFALMALAPSGGLLAVLAGVVVATIVSFLVALPIVKTVKETENNLEEATAKSKSNKLQKEEVKAQPAQISTDLSNVSAVVFACDAGMGSSAMGASILRKKMNEANLDIAVSNASISNLTGSEHVIITHKDLTLRAKEKAPHAYHISVENFLASPKYDELILMLKEQN